MDSTSDCQTLPPLAVILDDLKGPSVQPQLGLPPRLATPSMCIEASLRRGEGFDFHAIYNHFCLNFSPKVAVSIVNHLEEYETWATCLAPIVSISQARCFSLPSNTLPFDRWPVILWNDGGMEILQLYHVDDTGFCNYLAHYGMGKHSTSEGKMYLQSSIAWGVNRLGNLWPLCVGAQHLTWTIFVRKAASLAGDTPVGDPEKFLPFLEHRD